MRKLPVSDDVVQPFAYKPINHDDRIEPDLLSDQQPASLTLPVNARAPTHFVHAALRCGLGITCASMVLRFALGAFTDLKPSEVMENAFVTFVVWTVVSLIVFAIYAIGKPKGTDYRAAKTPFWIVIFLIVLADLYLSFLMVET